MHAREGTLLVQLRRISGVVLHRGRVSKVLRGRIRLRRAVIIILSRRRRGSAAVILGGIRRSRRRRRVHAVRVLVERGDGRVRAVTVVRQHGARAVAPAGAKVMPVHARRERVLQHDRRTPEGARVDVHRLALAVSALSVAAAQEKGDDEAGDCEADKAADDGNSDRGCTD